MDSSFHPSAPVATASAVAAPPARPAAALHTTVGRRRPLPRLLDATPELGLLGFVLVLALVLRLPGLLVFPFDQDELYTVMEATDLFATHLQPGIEARPLYFLYQHALFWLFPDPTPLALRATPTVLGVVSVWVTWLLGRRVAGPTAGAAAAFLLAISPWHLYVSGMARYWALVYLASAAFLLFFVRGRESGRPADHLAALLALICGSMSHPSFVFPLVGGLLGASLVTAEGRGGWRWPARREWLLLWLPYALFLGAAFLALRLSGNGEAVRNFGGRGLLSTLRLLPAVVEWITPTMAGAGAAGALLLLGSRRSSQRLWGAMAALGSLGTLALLAAASLRTDVYADYAGAMMPFVFVSAGALVQLGRDRLARPTPLFAGAAVAVLAMGILPSTVSHLLSGTRFDYRPAFRAIESTAPEVAVLTWPKVLQERYAPGLAARELRMSPDSLDAALAASGDLWVVASIKRHGIARDDTGAVEAWIAAHCRREGAWENPRLDYRQYRVELHRCRPS